MSDISKINVLGVDYNIKDSFARDEIANANKVKVIKLTADDDIQAALDEDTPKIIIFPARTTMVVTQPLFLNNDTTIDLNGSTIYFNYTRPTTTFPLVDWDETMGFMGYKADDTYTGYNGIKNIVIKNGTIMKGCSNFMHSVNVTFDNVEFVGLGNRHAMQYAACNGVTIKNCVFNGAKYESGAEASSGCINIDCCNYGAQPYPANTSPMFDHTMNKNFVIKSNTFKDGDGVTQVYELAIDAHGGDTNGNSEYTIIENIAIENNNFGSPRNCCISMRDWINVTIANNAMNCSSANPVPFIRKIGFNTDVYAHDNICENCSNFIASNTPNLPFTNFNFSSNKITGLDLLNDANATFQLFNAKKGKISNNTIKFQHHLIHLNSRDYFDGTSIGSDGYCDDIEFSNNVVEKTLASASYFGAFRIASSSDIKIDQNSILHDDSLQDNYEDFLIQSNVTSLKVSNNFTDAPYQFVPPENVSALFNNNNARYVIINESPSYDATSGSGTLRSSITNFSGLLLQLGHTSNMESVVIRPWLPTAYQHGNKFDSTSRVWKIPVSKDDGTFGVITLTIQNATYSWTGDIAIRKIYGLD